MHVKSVQDGKGTMTIEQYIEQTILPQYDAFDGGHKRDHAQMVIDESLKLAREHGADEQMAYVIAAYHDLGLRYDRETHHIHSGEILMADKMLRQWFTGEQLRIMRDAVEDHRASSKNPPRTIYGAIVAEADRQINPMLVIHRTMAFSRKMFPDGDFDTLYQRSKEHLLEKYAEGGYMRLWLNSERNVRSLEDLRAIIRNESRLRAMCKDWYMNELTISIKPFDQLTTRELYEILRARFLVFVMEQHCDYPDPDRVDYRATHFFIEEGHEIVAYARLFRKEASDTWRFGRMLTTKRGEGYGKRLLNEIIAYTKQIGASSLSMEAQMHAVRFYEKFGFKTYGEPFMDAGIEHIEMRRDI